MILFKAFPSHARNFLPLFLSLFCDNCHSHVANALNRMNVKAYGIRNWDMVKLAFLVFFKGRFLSWYAIYAQFGPFLIMVLVFALAFGLTK